MVEVVEDNKKKEKKGKKERRCKKRGEKIPMSGLNPRPPILQPMSLPLNYAYVFIIAIANLIFNERSLCLLSLLCHRFMKSNGAIID